MRRICHICGKPYEYPSTDPDKPVSLRRCSDCIKIKKFHNTWTCTCGKTFTSRDRMYDHRREMKNAGTPCKAFVYDEPTGKCPFCGQPIGMSKNKIETHRDCLVNHRCDGVIAAEAMGISLRHAVEYLQKVKRNNNMKNRVISVADDKYMQLSWIQSLLEKHGFKETVSLQDSWTLIDQLVLSPQLKAVFIFDENISEKSRKLYQCLHWQIFDLKWTDCILHREEIEEEIIKKLRNKES